MLYLFYLLYLVQNAIMISVNDLSFLVPKSVQKHAKVSEALKSVQKCKKVGKKGQKCAKACKTTQKHTKAHKGTQKYAKVHKSMQRHTKVCKNVQMFRTTYSFVLVRSTKVCCTF